jgi:hypothetical protein
MATYFTTPDGVDGDVFTTPDGGDGDLLLDTR